MNRSEPRSGTKMTSRHQARAEVGSRLTASTQTTTPTTRAMLSRARLPVIVAQSRTARGVMCRSLLRQPAGQLLLKYRRRHLGAEPPGVLAHLFDQEAPRRNDGATARLGLVLEL